MQFNLGSGLLGFKFRVYRHSKAFFFCFVAHVEGLHGHCRRKRPATSGDAKEWLRLHSPCHVRHAKTKSDGSQHDLRVSSPWPRAKKDSGSKSLPSSAHQEENLKGGSHETEFRHKVQSGS